MRTIAKLASPLNWSRPRARRNANMPCYVLFTDQARLADPAKPDDVLARLPRGAAVVLRHTDAAELAALARRTVARAHALGLSVLLAGNARLALALGCDGVHLSESRARRGPLRITGLPPGFIVTAAAHTHGPGGAHIQLALWRAARAGAHLIFVSPVFATDSHPDVRALGVLRFARTARYSPRPVAALGGVTAQNARRLRLGPARALGAIGAWRE